MRGSVQHSGKHPTDILREADKPIPFKRTSPRILGEGIGEMIVPSWEEWKSIDKDLEAEVNDQPLLSGSDRACMRKDFELRWAAGETKWDTSWGWRLLPLSPPAFAFAKGALGASWVGWDDGIQAGANKLELFVYTDRTADRDHVLSNLREAGFSENDIDLINDKPSVEP